MITIVNKHTFTGDFETVVNVMRPNLLGNPESIEKWAGRVLKPRDHVIELYKLHIWSEILKKGAIYNELKRLADLHRKNYDLVLMCCCTPLRCHAEVTKAAIEWLSRQPL